VRIVIELADREPPTGWVVEDGHGRRLTFTGWLDLLRVLAQLLDELPGDARPSA
jgi:hypothetical protein